MKKIIKTLFALTLAVSIMGSSAVVLAEDVSTPGTADVPVTVSVNSIFKVSLPASIDITKEVTSKDYDIQIIADLNPSYKLVIAPVDGYTTDDGDTTSDVNILLKDTFTGSNTKSDIVATITAATTEVTANIENLDTNGTTLTHNLSVNPDTLSAGEWKGYLKYSISVVPIN